MTSCRRTILNGKHGSDNAEGSDDMTQTLVEGDHIKKTCKTCIRECREDGGACAPQQPKRSYWAGSRTA